MSRRREKDTEPEPQVEPRVSRQARKQRQLKIALVFLVAAVALAIGAVFLYQTYEAPFNRAVVKVDNTSVSMGYFLKRTKLADADPTSMLQQLTYEQLVKISAAKYGISVSQSDLDSAVRSIAANSSANVTDNSTQSAPPLSEAAFQSWYKNELKTSGLSDAEYKDMVRTNLIASQLQTILANSMPTKAAQVHLYVMVLGSQADAVRAKAMIAGGESFQDVARSLSLDAQTKDNGGEVGWVPPGIYPPYDNTIFSLNAGQVSDPIATSQTSGGQYVIFMVSEKDPSRDIEASQLETLKANVLYNWLTQEVQQHSVDYKVDSQTMAWIQWQLAKK